MKKRWLQRMPLVFGVLLILIFPMTALAETNRQEQEGFPEGPGEMPESIDGIYDGLQEYYDALFKEQNDGSCTENGIVEVQMGIGEFGAEYKKEEGSVNENQITEDKTVTSWVDISGIEKEPGTVVKNEVIVPGETITTHVPVTGNQSKGEGTTKTENGTISSNHNETAADEPEKEKDILPSIRDLENLSDYDKYNILFSDMLLQMETENTRTEQEPKNPEQNNSDRIPFSGGSVTINGKDYYMIGESELGNAVDQGDGSFIIQTTTGNTIRVELELIPGSESEWRVKDFVITYIEEEEYEYENMEGWTRVSIELMYGYWEWKNMTNSKWKAAHENRYYPVGGSSDTAVTKGSKTLRYSLGHGPYDNGTWSVKMTPYMREYWEKEIVTTYTEIDEKGNVTEYEETDIISRVYEEVPYSATYYEVTVPLVCDTCPEISICLSDENDCDCGSLNTKCDDEHDPEYEVDLRSELEK